MEFVDIAMDMIIFVYWQRKLVEATQSSNHHLKQYSFTVNMQIVYDRYQLCEFTFCMLICCARLCSLPITVILRNKHGLQVMLSTLKLVYLVSMSESVPLSYINVHELLYHLH